MNADKAIELGPFDFAPEWISRLPGLGGTVPGPDPNYVFHSPYRELGEDEFVAMIQFDGLTASGGMIVLRISAYPRYPGAIAYQIAAAEFPLWTAKDDKPMEMTFRSSSDALYAVMGHVYNETDATATGLRIVLRRTSEVAAEAEQLASTRRTQFGAPKIRQVGQLVTTAPPSLAEPVSQMATAAQNGEPVYATWAARLQPASSPSRRDGNWRPVYILQVLRRFGMLEPGARGIGFGSDAGRLAAILAEEGCLIVRTDGTADDVAPARGSESPGDDAPPNRVSHRPVDVADLPEELAGFDFLWSQPDPATFGSVALASDFINRSLACLKPAGLAVHTVAFHALADDGAVDAEGNPLFRRGDLEQLAMSLLGDGHEVAQLNCHNIATPGPTAFGFIVRRGLHT